MDNLNHRTKPTLVYENSLHSPLTAFGVTQTYINDSDIDVLVVLRNNLKVNINKTHELKRGNNSFIIRTVYHFNDRKTVVATLNELASYKDVSDIVSEDLHMIHKSLSLAYSNNNNLSVANVAIDRSINTFNLKQLDTMYITETDVLISVNTTEPLCHPYSMEGSTKSAYGNIVNNRNVSGIFVEIIDNEHAISNRFMYVCKQVVEIPVIKDKSRSSGVYYGRIDRGIVTEPNVCDLSVMSDVLGIYSNKEQALTGGDPGVLSKTVLKEKESAVEHQRHLNEIAKNELAIILSDYKKTIAEDEAKYKLIALEQDRKMEDYKREAMKEKEDLLMKNAKIKEKLAKKKSRREDYYEDKSYNRKDNYETIKTIGILASGALGLFAILKK
jgi:hypothetical protein